MIIDRRKIVPGLIFGVTGLGIILAMPSLMSAYEARQERVGRVKDLQNNLEQAQLEQELSTERKALAEQRYADGCLVMVDESATYVSLSPTQTVVDRRTGDPLPDETVICDIRGITAVTLDGRPTSFAFTGNHELVRESIERAERNRGFVSPSETQEDGQ